MPARRLLSKFVLFCITVELSACTTIGTSEDISPFIVIDDSSPIISGYQPNHVLEVVGTLEVPVDTSFDGVANYIFFVGDDEPVLTHQVLEKEYQGTSVMRSLDITTDFPGWTYDARALIPEPSGDRVILWSQGTFMAGRALSLAPDMHLDVEVYLDSVGTFMRSPDPISPGEHYIAVIYNHNTFDYF